MRRILERKVTIRGLAKIQVSDGTAEQIPAEDESFDCVVAFLIFCGVSNPRTAFEEIKRVLRPGGYFVFLEHVAAAEGTSTRRWQNRLNSIWRIMAGCNLNRETEKAIITAGFKMRQITREINRKALITRTMIRGIAEKV
jgi:ubiquinone/menaquinone biosynthesis C-methylase UbiE